MKFRMQLAGSMLALALAACSSGSPEETSEAPEPGASETAAPAATETAAPEASETEAAAEETAPEPSPTPTPTPTPTAKPTPTPPPAPAKVAAVAEVPAVFKQRCAVCHDASKDGKDKLGPNLYGVYGHPAGQGTFAFSTALKESGLVLDDAGLNAWLENPRKAVPGNRMSFPGLKDPAQRQAIIDYLKQQR